MIEGKHEVLLYIDPGTFCGDSKAFFARLVTLGWIVRLRHREKRNPLVNAYTGKINNATVVIPLLYQLTGRPLIDLVEDYYHGPQLSNRAFHLMLPSTIRDSVKVFRMMLFDYGPEMNADFHTAIQWFDDSSVFPENDDAELQSSFLKTPDWNFLVRWGYCSLEYRSYRPSEDGINRVICHQIAGGWRPFGYVRRHGGPQAADEMKSLEDGSTIVAPATRMSKTLERNACVCNKAIELHAALLAYKPRLTFPQSLLGNHILQLKEQLGLSDFAFYEKLAELFKEFVFWHECGHIHYDPMELELRQSLVAERYFHERYGYDYSELAAECYAIARCVDPSSPETRQLYLTFFLYDEARFDQFSLCELVKIRALHEPVPSEYILEFINRSIEKLRRASQEVERRLIRAGLEKDDLMWSSHVQAELDKGDAFTDWQAAVERRVRKDVAKWLNL